MTTSKHTQYLQIQRTDHPLLTGWLDLPTGRYPMTQMQEAHAHLDRLKREQERHKQIVSVDPDYRQRIGSADHYQLIHVQINVLVITQPEINQEASTATTDESALMLANPRARIFKAAL